MKIINSKEEFEELIQRKILIDFYADWCGPCKMMSLELDKMDNEIEIAKLNVDNFGDIAREYKVMSIPCLILFENGQEIKRNIGYINKEQIVEFIK